MGSKTLLAIVGMAIGVALTSSAYAKSSGFRGRVIINMQQEVDTMQVFVQGSKYLLRGRFGGEDENVLADRKSRSIDAWPPGGKQYHESTLDNVVAAFVDPFAAVDATRTLSNGKMHQVGVETVHGYACDKFVLTDKSGTELIDYWIAQKFDFPIKFTEPNGGATLDVDEIVEEQVPDSLLTLPKGMTLAEEPGSSPPKWAKDVPKAPRVRVPYKRVLTAGQIIRVRPREGDSLEVVCEHTSKNAQFCAVPFKDGNPIENVMMDTYTFSGMAGEKWTQQFPAFSSRQEDEFVIRMNRGHGQITVRPVAANPAR